MSEKYDFRKDVDALLARMRTPEAKKAARGLFEAYKERTMSELECDCICHKDSVAECFEGYGCCDKGRSFRTELDKSNAVYWDHPDGKDAVENVVSLANFRDEKAFEANMEAFEDGRMFRFVAFDFDPIGHSGFIESDADGREVLLLINPREEDSRELVGYVMTREDARKLGQELLEVADAPPPVDEDEGD